MHDEFKDLLLLIVVIFAIIIGVTIAIGYNMKGDYRAVKTLTSHYFLKDYN
jgi:hypothetical protein